MREITVAEYKAELDKLRDLLIIKNKAVRAQKTATKAYKQHMAYVRDLADHLGVPSIKTERGGYEAPEPTWYAKVQDFDQFKDWADANGLDGAYDYNHRASAVMNQLVQEAIDNNQPLPPGLGAFARAPIRVKGVREEELGDDT